MSWVKFDDGYINTDKLLAFGKNHNNKLAILLFFENRDVGVNFICKTEEEVETKIKDLSEMLKRG
jgi:hypothetical protein